MRVEHDTKNRLCKKTVTELRSFICEIRQFRENLEDDESGLKDGVCIEGG